MEQKIKMGQRKFRIGELAEQLNVKKFVIRFWEKEFDLKSDRSGGGQRFYSQEDFEKFTLIKNLLYVKKFTIPGAKNQIQSLNHSNNITPAIKEPEQNNPQIQEDSTNEYNEIFTKIKHLKQQLENFAAKLNFK